MEQEIKNLVIDAVNIKNQSKDVISLLMKFEYMYRALVTHDEEGKEIVKKGSFDTVDPGLKTVALEVWAVLKAPIAQIEANPIHKAFVESLKNGFNL